MTIFSIIILVIGLYIFILGISNVIFLKTKEIKQAPTKGPLVSVLIPARNEEHHIGDLLISLVNQDYENYEILVIDDNSTDKTWEVIQGFVTKYPFITGYKGKPKVLKVNGKTYALSQIEVLAKGEILLSTDADTVHAPNSISTAVALLKNNELDLGSGFPQEACPSFLGSCCINAMNFAVVAYIPLAIVYKHPSPFFTLANGQLMVMNKEKLHSIGGYERICEKLTDDVTLAKHFVKEKKRYSLLPIASFIKCNMYTSYKEAFWGITRSIGGIFPANLWILPPILIIVAALLTIAFSPLIAILFGIYGLYTECLLTAIGCLLFTISWYSNSRRQEFSRLVSFCWPLTVILLCSMYFASYFTRMKGKTFTWKDREV